MKKTEFIQNLLLGLSVISWSFFGCLKAYSLSSFSIVRLVVVSLNLFVGLLIIFRKPLVHSSNIKAIFISLPSFICSGLAFKMAQQVNHWSLYTTMLFSFGGLITMISFMYLGRNFSIMPALRGISVNGPFQIIRHPAYLGEFMMLLACILCNPSYFSFAIFLFSIPFMILRIYEEEKILYKSIDYQIYSKAIKWKLIPFIW